MAFPDSAILDNFNRANQVLSQSADWGDLIGFRVTSNRAVSTVSSVWNPTAWLTGGVLTNCEAYALINDYGPALIESVGVWARYDPIAGSGYHVMGVRNTGTVTLYRQNGAGRWSLGSWTPGLAVGDSLGIRCQGTTITAYHKPGAGAWATLGSVVDTNYGSGYIGMVGYRTVEIDSFGGGATAGGAFPATPILDTFTQADTEFAPPNSDWADLSALWVLSQACAPPAYYGAPTADSVWDTAITGLQGEVYFTHPVLMDDGDSVRLGFRGNLGGNGGEIVFLAVMRDDVGGDEWEIVATGGTIGPIVQDVLAGDGIGLAYDDDTGRAQAYHYTPSVGVWAPILTGLLVGTFPTSTAMRPIISIESGAIDDFGGGATSGIVMPTSTGPTPRVAAWQRPDIREAEEV